MEQDDNLKIVDPSEAPNDPWEALAWFLDQYHIIRSGEGREPLTETESFISQGRNISLPQVITIDGEKRPYKIGPLRAYRIINSCVKVLEKQLEGYASIFSLTETLDTIIANLPKEPSKNALNDIKLSLQSIGFDKETNALRKELDITLNSKNVEALKTISEKIAAKKIPAQKENNIVDGLLTLADSLFTMACTHPEGRFTLHKPDTKKKQITLHPHAKRVKGLTRRLLKYKSSREAFAKIENLAIDLPALCCKEVFAQEEKASLQIWKIVDLENYTNENPFDLLDSLDDREQKLGQHAVAESIEEENFSNEDPESMAMLYREEIDHLEWAGIPNLGRVRNYITVNPNVASDLKSSIWNYEEDPLTFIVNYISSQAKPCLEEANSLVIQALNDSNSQQVGSLALTLDAKNKENPDSYLKVIQRVSKHFQSGRSQESEHLIKKLNCARFNLCLDTVNRQTGINATEFRIKFEERIYKIINNPDTAGKTRNEILMELFLETDESKEKNYGQRDAEIWLENLQSKAVGAYENSQAMEAYRDELILQINNKLDDKHQEIENIKAAITEGKSDTEKLETVYAKLEKTLHEVATDMYNCLTGVAGQAMRRELRHKINTIKKDLENRLVPRLGAKGLKEAPEYAALTETGKFTATISSQVKTGEWFTKEKENKEVLFHFLKLMMQLPIPPKRNINNIGEFEKSERPENTGNGNDSLAITIDFLKNFSSEMIPCGKTTIEQILALWKEEQSMDEDGQTAAALSKITKTKMTSIKDIKDRKDMLGGAIDIAKGAALAKNGLSYLNSITATEAAILTIPADSQELPNPLDAKPNQTTPPVIAKGEVDGGAPTLQSDLDSAITWLAQQTSIISTEANEERLTPESVENAIKAINAGTVVLQTPNLDKGKEEELLQNILTLKNLVHKRFQENLCFWKGLQYISGNISSRHEADLFQISRTGLGTLGNLKKKAEAKVEGKDISKSKNGDALKQFDLTVSRRRTLLSNITGPIAIWLSEPEKGTTTKISQDDFIKTLETRYSACDICLEINKDQDNLEQKLSDFQERELKTKLAINADIIQRCIDLLTFPEDLKDGLEWENRNKSAAIDLAQKRPDLDTAISKIQYLRETQSTKTQKIEKVEEIEKNLDGLTVGM